MMMSFIPSWRRVALACVLFTAALATQSAAPSGAATAALQIQDLGTLPGGTFSQANDINNRGWVVGESGQASGEGLGHAFLWRDGRMLDLGTLGEGQSSRANGINDRGWVVGATETGGPAVHAFLWRDGTMLDLGTLGGEFSEAMEVNNRGVVVGNSETASGTLRPFVWYRGVMRELNVAGGITSFATAVNARGQVTGAIIQPGGVETEAYRWDRGSTTLLGTLPADFRSSDGSDINDRGLVVGGSLSLSGAAHAVLWRDSRIVDLGTLGGPFSGAAGVNNRAWVVGASDTGDGTHAFLWRKGQMTDLGTLGFGFSSAAAVNERGVIVGSSLSDTGFDHAVIWR
jgi:probable HAF family extracellular repeat protein